MTFVSRMFLFITLVTAISMKAQHSPPTVLSLIFEHSFHKLPQLTTKHFVLFSLTETVLNL